MSRVPELHWTDAGIASKLGRDTAFQDSDRAKSPNFHPSSVHRCSPKSLMSAAPENRPFSAMPPRHLADQNALAVKFERRFLAVDLAVAGISWER
jgi:hypothetical protein